MTTEALREAYVELLLLKSLCFEPQEAEDLALELLALRPTPLAPWRREAAELALFIQQLAAMRAADPPAIQQRVAKGALNTISEKAASLLAILSRPAPTVCPENQGLSADNCAASAPASGRGNPTLANKEVGR